MGRTASRTSAYLSEIVANLRAASGSSLAAVLTIAVAVAIFGALWMLQATLGEAARAWERLTPVVLFLEENLPLPEVGALRTRLRRQPGVLEIEFISKQEALQEFRDASLPGHAAAREALARLEGNPLPASLVLRYDQGAPTAPAVPDLVAELATWPGIEEVATGAEAGAPARRRRDAFAPLARTMGGLLALGLLVVVVNTVRLTIAARGEEIAIMRLVGASPMFIRLPLLCEGMLQALAGALLAIVFLAGLAAAWPARLLPLLPAGAAPAHLQVLPLRHAVGLVGAAAVLGAVGSFVAVRCYLKGS